MSGLEEQLRHARFEAAAAVAERDRRGDVGWRTREVGLIAEAATLRATNAALEEEARRLRGRLGLELTGNRAAAHVLGSQLSAMRDEQQAQQATQRLLEDANLHLVNELRRASPPRRGHGRAAAPPSRVSSVHAAAAAASVLSAHRGLDPGAAHLSSWEAEVEAGARTRLGLHPQPQPHPQHRSPDHSRSRSRSPTRKPPLPAAADGYAWSLPHPLGGLAEARGSILDALSPPPPPPTTPATARPGPGPNAQASIAAAAYGAARHGGAAPAVARAQAAYAASSYDEATAAGGAGPALPEVLPVLEPHAFRLQTHACRLHPPASKAATPCIQVRLILEPHVFLSPQQIHELVLAPAGAGHALAIAAVGARETRVTFRSWEEAYRVLCYCSPELQNDLGLRCRPGLASGVQMTKTEMARLAQAEQSKASEGRSQYGAGTSAGLRSPRSASGLSPRGAPFTPHKRCAAPHSAGLR